MKRRGFLGAVLAAAAAPAIVRADALMRVVPLDQGILTADSVDEIMNFHWRMGGGHAASEGSEVWLWSSATGKFRLMPMRSGPSGLLPPWGT